jgi:hypothetical protein
VTCGGAVGVCGPEPLGGGGWREASLQWPTRRPGDRHEREATSQLRREIATGPRRCRRGAIAGVLATNGLRRVLRGRPRVRQPGVLRVDPGRGRPLVHAPEEPRLVRREPLVGGGDRRGRGARGRASTAVPASSQAARHRRGPEGPACRALHRPESGCRLAGVARRRCEPRAGGCARENGGRSGNLGLGAAEPRPRHAGDEHAHRNVRSLRRSVVGSALGDDPGA